MVWPSLNYQAPGVHTAQESVENVVTWGDPLLANMYRFNAVIDGASRDGSHTGNTTILRPGLLMGYHQANKLWLPYDSALGATVGGTLQGVIAELVNVQLNGSDIQRVGGFIFAPGAPIKVSALYTNDGTDGPVSGHANEATIRTALEALNYRLDDWFQD